MLPKSHRSAFLVHCPSAAGWAIPERLLTAYGEPTVLELEPGVLLLMHQRTIHASLANRTATDVRVSLDLHYQPAGEASGRPAYPSMLVRSASGG